MSGAFGLSSGGGQVRYAVLFDSTQAEQNVRRYQTSLQQLATGTTGVSGKMAIMNNTFTAGVTPIKNQGNALNQLAMTQKTIGSQLGGLGSAFKSNALAIGAAASSVLGLYQNYANLSSAQNAANKSATAAKAAQNSVATATKALNKAIDQYGQGSKEAKAAQDKLTVAQERAVNKTESAKIAQDNLNQTMADFGINILPNIILAGGSIVSIFDNIGKSGSGVTGIVSKLGGVFGGLGGGIKGTVIPAIAGLMGAGGLSGLTEKFKSASTSATGFGGSLLGMATAAGIGLGAALLIIDQINKAQDHMEQVGIRMSKTKFGGQLFSQPELKQSLAQLDELFAATHRSALQLMFDAEETKKAWIDAGGKIDKAGNIIWGSFNKSVEAGKKFVDLGPGFQATGADYVKWSTNMLNSGKSEVDVMNFLLGSHIKLIDAIKIEGAAMENHNKFVTQSNTLSQAQLNIISRLNEAMATARQQDIDVAAALGEVISKTTEAADDAKRQADAVKLLDTALNKTIPSLLKFAEAGAKSAEATKLVGDMVKLTKDRMIEWNPAAGASADIMSTIDGVLAGLPAKQATWTNSINASTKAEEKAKKALEDWKKLAEESDTAFKAVFKIESNADKIFKDLVKALPNKVEKKLKLTLKFEQNVADAKTSFQNFLVRATEVDDKTADTMAKDVINMIDKKFKGAKGPFANLRAALKTAIADPNTPEALKKLLAGEDWKPTGKKVGEQFGNAVGVSASKEATDLLKQALKKFDPSKYIADPNNTKKKGVFKSTDKSLFNSGGGGGTTTSPPITVAIQGDNRAAIKAVDVVAKRILGLSAIMPTITLNNAKAFQMIDQIVIRINALTGIVPKINVDNAPAVKKIDQIVKRILDLAGVVPKINVNNTPAIKKVDQVAKRIQDLANIEPKININNTQAIKKVDQIAKRILDLPDGEVTIKVKTSGSTPAGTKFDSGGFKGDTSSLFVGGSKSDSGGGGGGDTIINVHVMDETIMRRITARSGRGRFTMGA